MKLSRCRPFAQIFVCTHARPPDDPLASGCGVAGPDVFRALKSLVIHVAGQGDVWVTATACLGHCPRKGCSVTVHPHNVHFVEVTAADAEGLIARARAPVPPRMTPPGPHAPPSTPPAARVSWRA